MFVIRSMLSDLLITFWSTENLVLKIICSVKSRRVHFVSDSYGNSIKTAEQEVRGSSDGGFLIIALFKTSIVPRTSAMP